MTSEPKRYEVRISTEASANLTSIFRFIERQSPQNAVLVINRLFDAIDSLDLFPYRYKVHRAGARVALEVRSMPVRPFVVYYRVLEADGIVRILTVRHGSQKQPDTFE